MTVHMSVLCEVCCDAVILTFVLVTLAISFQRWFLGSFCNCSCSLLFIWTNFFPYNSLINSYRYNKIIVSAAFCVGLLWASVVVVWQYLQFCGMLVALFLFINDVRGHCFVSSAVVILKQIIGGGLWLLCGTVLWIIQCYHELLCSGCSCASGNISGTILLCGGHLWWLYCCSGE